MRDLGTYRIQMQGYVEESEFNAMSPIQARTIHMGQVSTMLIVWTDQSGLVGLVRHLHGLGLVFLAIDREPTGSQNEEE